MKLRDNKKCPKCNTIKIISQFRIGNKNGKQILISYCIDCEKEYAKEYVAKNREKIKKYKREYREENITKINKKYIEKYIKT